MNKLTNKLLAIMAAFVVILGTGAGNLPGNGNPNPPKTPGTSENGGQQPGNDDGNGGETCNPNCDGDTEDFYYE